MVPAIVILPYTLKLITLGPTTQSTCKQSGGQGQKQQPIKTEDFQDMLAHHLPLTGTSYQLFNKPTEDNCYDICIWGEKRRREKKRLGGQGGEERGSVRGGRLDRVGIPVPSRVTHPGGSFLFLSQRENVGSRTKLLFWLLPPRLASGAPGPATFWKRSPIECAVISV